MVSGKAFTCQKQVVQQLLFRSQSWERGGIRLDLVEPGSSIAVHLLLRRSSFIVRFSIAPGLING